MNNYFCKINRTNSQANYFLTVPNSLEKKKRNGGKKKLGHLQQGALKVKNKKHAVTIKNYFENYFEG